MMVTEIRRFITDLDAAPAANPKGERQQEVADEVFAQAERVRAIQAKGGPAKPVEAKK